MSLSGYRDSAALSIYCKYADIYRDRTNYADWQDELSDIRLQYDTNWQQEIDTLVSCLKEYKAEKTLPRKPSVKGLPPRKNTAGANPESALLRETSGNGYAGELFEVYIARRTG